MVVVTLVVTVFILGVSVFGLGYVIGYDSGRDHSFGRH